MDKKKWQQYIVIATLIIIFSLFVYPGMYKYDKLHQNLPVKINRITGSTQVLSANGWHVIDDPSGTEIDSLRKELYSKLTTDREQIKQEIVNSIKGQIVDEVKDDINKVKKDIQDYKDAQLDPNNYFSIGSTKEEVKKIMGTPDKIELSGYLWYYGNSSINFTGNPPIVTTFNNINKNLKVK